MICPYNCKSKIERQVWNQNTDPDSDPQILKDGETITKTIYEYMDCLKEECGAYRDGKCCYQHIIFNDN